MLLATFSGSVKCILWRIAFCEECIPGAKWESPDWGFSFCIPLLLLVLLKKKYLLCYFFFSFSFDFFSFPIQSLSSLSLSLLHLRSSDALYFLFAHFPSLSTKFLPKLFLFLPDGDLITCEGGWAFVWAWQWALWVLGWGLMVVGFLAIAGGGVGWGLTVVCGCHGLRVGDCDCRSNGPNCLKQIHLRLHQFCPHWFLPLFFLLNLLL